MRLATGPVSWGVDFAGDPSNPPWQSVLDDIRDSGVGALELGPVGYLPEEPDALRAALVSRGLTAVGSFVFDDFHDPARADAVAEATVRACRAIAAAGGAVLVLIDRPRGARVATAGRSEVAVRLAGDAWRAMTELFERSATIARDHGLRPVVHPHAGSHVEFEDEVERLLADTDLDLCLDTGHAAYAGMDPVRAIRAHADRIGHVHLKDVRPEVLAHARQAPLDFWQAVAAGVFCPLGDGVVDLSGILAALRDARYDGYATIEQDRVPGSGAPLDDLIGSLRVLGAAEAVR